jgi:hypothetical protein
MAKKIRRKANRQYVKSSSWQRKANENNERKYQRNGVKMA